MFRVFISHTSEHKVFAAELQTQLLKYGISAFVAHNDIEPTLEWQLQIETALATADSLLAVLTPDFHSSKWTDQEIGHAIGKGIPVFSVRRGLDPYGFIGRIQAFQGIGKTAREISAELFESYRSNKQSAVKMGCALIGMFEVSSSFTDAKTCMAYIEGIQVW